MQREKPCCPAAAARMVKKLTLPDGFQVGILNLESILKEVADLKLADDEAIKKELLQRVKIYNYVASAADNDYSAALLREYKRQYAGVKNNRRVMLLHDYKITKVRRSLCHPEWIAVTAEVGDDISEVFPYLNAVLKNAVYTPRVPSLNFKMETGFTNLMPQEIDVGQVLCKEDAIKILDYLRELINDTWERRESIIPLYERKEEIKAKDIVDFLPRTNCRECGLPTCFAFAVAMMRGQKRLKDCSALSEPEFAEDKEALVRLLGTVASEDVAK